jgi:hypothetical protein
MVRTQIQLSPSQAEAVKRLAAEQGISMAELIRQSVDAYLSGARRPTQDEVRQRAMALAGCLRGGPADLAVRHDDYLAEAFGQ